MNEFGIYHGKEILQDERDVSVPIVESVLWRNDVVFLLGSEKSGKSITAQQIACTLTKSGTLLFDAFKNVKDHIVLYVQTEGKRSMFSTRLKSMLNGVDAKLNNLYHLFLPGIELDTAEGYGSLMGYINKKQVRPDLIIIDPLYTAIRGDMCNSQAAQTFVRNVRHVAGKYDSAVIIVHHTHRSRKNPKTGKVIDEGDNSIFGSFVWKAFADHVFLQRLSLKTKEVTITCDTQRSAEVVDRINGTLISPKDDGDKPLMITTVNPDSKNIYIRVHTHMKNNKKQYFINDIIEEFNVSKSTAYRVLGRLEGNGMISKCQCVETGNTYYVTT